jgi:hypothetical protein
MKRKVLLATLAATLTGAPSITFGHFVLEKPLSWQEQNLLGDPQKAGPCGDPGMKTGKVTELAAGETVHFEFVETIVHGGHYRIALGLTGQGDLPPDPPVMARSGVSISAPIQNPPQFPVLADGLHVHDGSISAGKRWAADVKLPAGMTCNQCVLQITQFMTDHGSNTGGNDGFFYHHCAVVTIKAAAAPDAAAPPAADAAAPPDAGHTSDTRPATGGSAGAPATGGTGGSTPAPSGGSGGCAVGGGSSSGLLLLLILLSAFRARRTGRSPGRPARRDGARANPPAPRPRWPGR